MNAKTPKYWKRATRELSAADPVLGGLITRHQGLTLASRGDAFQTLARSTFNVRAAVSTISHHD